MLFGVSVDDEAVAAVDVGGVSVGAVSNHVPVVTGAEMADGSIVGTGAEVDNVGTATATVVLGASEISSSP